MIQIINNKHDLENLLIRLKSRSVVLDSELLSFVASIISDVQQRGDDALIDYGKRFDGVELSRAQLRFSETELERCAAIVDAKLLEAIRKAITNIKSFHRHQLEKSWKLNPAEGITVGQRVGPIERVGLYIPGGTAAYPSSVIMNVVPATVAGVKRIVVTTPPRALVENSAVAAALIELNVTEVYAVGGAQAIAALAFGTETLPKVDKITGPGNKYVAAAKKLVFGAVGIDSIAGPSEVVIVADDTATPQFIAADLLAQAEHGVDASSLLITTSEALATHVVLAVKSLVERLPRRDTIAKSLSNYGAIILVSNLREACSLVNELAPEHVELVTEDDEMVAANIEHAGAIFLGPFTPEAVGDYFAGPNHVLPTQKNARFASALGVYDFVKRTSILSYSQRALAKSARQIELLAEAEGLQAHARSVTVRAEEFNS